MREEKLCLNDNTMSQPGEVDQTFSGLSDKLKSQSNSVQHNVEDCDCNKGPFHCLICFSSYFSLSSSSSKKQFSFPAPSSTNSLQTTLLQFEVRLCFFESLIFTSHHLIFWPITECFSQNEEHKRRYLGR